MISEISHAESDIFDEESTILTPESTLSQNKEEITVLIITGNVPLAKLTPDGKSYQGILYDIWKLIRDKLKHKYTFIEIFSDDSNYDQMTKDTATSKYNVVIGPFQITSSRIKIINFTNNLIISKNAILHLPTANIILQIMTIIKTIILRPLMLLIVIGVILGWILNKVEPKRFKQASIPAQFALRRSIITVVASLFGEAGFLTENTTLSNAGILTVLFIMTLAFFFVLLLQAYITEKVLDMNTHMSHNKYNIKDKLLLSPTGYAVAKFMERYGAKIEYHDKSLPELVELYIKNPDKYIGISLDYYDAIGNERPELGLTTSAKDFGYKEVTWIVSKDKPKLLIDINLAMIPIQYNLEPYMICKKYISKSHTHLCNL